jgi:hypothetical protein
MFFIFKYKKYYFNTIDYNGYKLERFEYKNIIPFNLNYKLYKIDYHNNSPFKYYDFYTIDGFKNLLENKIILKKINNKPGLISSSEYNINRPIGIKLNNLIIPIECDTINKIISKVKIAYFYTVSESIDNLEVEVILRFKEFINSKNDIKIEIINFIAIDIKEIKNKKYVKWIPKKEIIIKTNNYFEMDLNDLMGNDEIDTEVYFEEIK